MLPFEKKNEKHTQLPSDVLTPNATIDSLSREIKSFTGVSADAPYEPPPHPEINLPNYKMTIDESVDLLVSELRKAGLERREGAPGLYLLRLHGFGALLHARARNRLSRPQAREYPPR